MDSGWGVASEAFFSTARSCKLNARPCIPGIRRSHPGSSYAVGGNKEDFFRDTGNGSSNGFTAAQIKRIPILNAFIRAVVMKKNLAAAIILCSATLAHAQTPLHTQIPDKSDVCAELNPTTADDMYSCAMEAWPRNKPVALKWWIKAADHGSRLAQFQLGNIFKEGDGVPQDFVQAYKWFDIAAATHGAEIDKLPPSTSPDDNQMEINYREDVAKHMTATQIAQAQKVAREWHQIK